MNVRPDTPSPKTLGELCDYIIMYADDIFIRSQGADGRFSSVALSALPASEAMRWVLLFVKRRVNPETPLEDK